MQGTILKLGPRGGQHGVSQNMELNGVTRIVKVAVGHEDIVVSISISFLRNGREERTSKWGGERGGLTEINLHPTEYFTSVKGYYGNYMGFNVVMSLTFESNLQTYGPFGEGELRTYGPFGWEEVVPFHLLTHGGKIIGFHGRSGELIDAIGTYVKFD